MISCYNLPPNPEIGTIVSCVLNMMTGGGLVLILFLLLLFLWMAHKARLPWQISLPFCVFGVYLFAGAGTPNYAPGYSDLFTGLTYGAIAMAVIVPLVYIVWRHGR